jgi:NAD(P)-dependent dehydrogenase (short-subunit alcohol dehydrogenase family)
MDLYMKDKIALVTGGASGIGQKTAAFFVQEGAKVFISDVQDKGIEKTLEMLRDLGGEVEGCISDVTDEQSVDEMVKGAVNRFGTIDFLVNSAGISGSAWPLESSPRKAWQKVLDVNLVGTILCCKAVAPILRAKKSGRIVNIASEAGVSGERESEIYCASKGGVMSVTKSLAKTLGRSNVTVNAVAPAFVHSPMTSRITPEIEKKWLIMYTLKRLGETEDVANMIVFLCSDRCSWITGQTISINGGFSMR